LANRRVPSGAPRWLSVGGVIAALAGAGLIEATAAIHMHLWLNGYRHIHRLGPLFLAQAVTGFVLGVVVAASRTAVVLAAGALFMAASATGLILSATTGFVGIHDGLDVPWATTSLTIELVGFVVLLAAAAAAEHRH
jgi:hypothetical protein